MTFTTYGREVVAKMLGSSLPNHIISYLAIGSGTGSELNSNYKLDNETLRVGLTGSPDFTESRKVLFRADINSVQFSGLNFREWGTFASGTLATGSLYTRNLLAGSITGDGTIEIVLQEAIEVM